MLCQHASQTCAHLICCQVSQVFPQFLTKHTHMGSSIGHPNNSLDLLIDFPLISSQGKAYPYNYKRACVACRISRHQRMGRRRRATCLYLLIWPVVPTLLFPDLTPGQDLLYLPRPAVTTPISTIKAQGPHACPIVCLCRRPPACDTSLCCRNPCRPPDLQGCNFISVRNSEYYSEENVRLQGNL